MSFGRLARALPRWWYQRPLAWPLIPFLPLSWLFFSLTALRRALFRAGVLSSFRLTVPVVVVGNLTVGGSGKTPLVLWLVRQLQAAGYRPGIISRGYGGDRDSVMAVTPDSASDRAGDEPVLLASRTGVPVFVGRDRVSAGRALLTAHPECNVVISDDGLQHYRLQRQVEIAVFDGRGGGNGHLLPAGPLREPLGRLSSVSAVVLNSVERRDVSTLVETAGVPVFEMRLVGSAFYLLADPKTRCGARDLAGRRLRAIAGIGDPSRFFATLESLGLRFSAHPFPDHHRYTRDDFDFARDDVLLMTEKDAVKCADLVQNDTWVLPVDAAFQGTREGPELLETILEKLDGRPFA